MEDTNRNRYQSYQEDWDQSGQDYDRYSNPYRYQRYGENYGNADWQNTGSDYGDMRQYENRRSLYNDRNRDYRGNWNRGYENRNYYRGNYGSNYRNNPEERNWWDRTQDEVASWFGDEDAERRRRMDKIYGPHRGKGPRGYIRSAERIAEDINEKLYHDPFVDASDIEVSVSEGVVLLTGTVESRQTKRRVEDLAESVAGVKDVTNQLKVDSTRSSQDETSESQATGHNGRKKSSWLG